LQERYGKRSSHRSTIVNVKKGKFTERTLVQTKDNGQSTQGQVAPPLSNKVVMISNKATTNRDNGG
jgi:hypothetical protein